MILKDSEELKAIGIRPDLLNSIKDTASKEKVFTLKNKDVFLKNLNKLEASLKGV